MDNEATVKNGKVFPSIKVLSDFVLYNGIDRYLLPIAIINILLKGISNKIFIEATTFPFFYCRFIINLPPKLDHKNGNFFKNRKK